jgi:membrane-associated phospholipid phosphatase
VASVTLRRGPVAFGTACLVVFLGLLITAGTTMQHDQVDRSIAEGAYRLTSGHRWVRSLARAATFLGSTGWLVALVVVATLALLWGHRWRSAVWIVTVSASSSVLVLVIKTLTARERPAAAHALATATGFAFPSGHATNSTVVYGALLLVGLPHISGVPLRRLLAGLVALLVLAIASSRVLLGVHWFTDVVAGLSLGLALLVLGSARNFRDPAG